MRLFLSIVFILVFLGLGIVIGAQNEHIITISYVIGEIQLHISTLMSLLIGLGLAIGLAIGALSVTSLKVKNALLRRKLNAVNTDPS